MGETILYAMWSFDQSTPQHWPDYRCLDHSQIQQLAALPRALHDPSKCLPSISQLTLLPNIYASSSPNNFP